MGLEWHNRKRSTNGRFEPELRTKLEGMGYRTEQLHLRVPANLAKRVRQAALSQSMEINEYCIRALELFAPKNIDELR